jgi:hypothetical protein
MRWVVCGRPYPNSRSRSGVVVTFTTSRYTLKRRLTHQVQRQVREGAATFLPGVWSGFGAFANATWMKAEGNDGAGGAIALAPNPRIAGFNPFVANIGISYIRNRLNLRGSFNHRGRYLVGFNANESRATYAAARPTLDLKFLYNGERESLVSPLRCWRRPNSSMAQRAISTSVSGPTQVDGRQIAPTELLMRRAGELSKALFETRFTAPPIESPSISGVGDLVTSIRSIESESTVWN